MLEANILKLAHLRLSELGARAFRNNTGTAWQGDITRLVDGRMLIANPRPFHGGLVKGSSDLIGWHSITVTPEMVGRRVALFLAVETKSPRGRATPEQQNFIERVREAGGVAGVVRDADDVESLLRGASGC